MGCNGIGVSSAKGQGKTPKLLITHFTLEPGATLEPPGDSDCLLIGINGGDLLNEKPPFLHVDLGSDSVTLMPREQPFRLRNKGSENAEFRMIEIRRYGNLRVVGNSGMVVEKSRLHSFTLRTTR